MHSKSKTLIALVAILSTVVLLGSIGLSADDSDLEEITFRLNWIPQGNHSVFYVAKHFGWYEDEGLKVNVQRGSGSGDSVKHVDVGKVPMAMANAGTAAVGRARGSDLKVIAVVYVRSPFAIWARKDKGVEEPKDLEGSTIGAPPGDSQRVYFPAFAKATGIDPDKVTWVNIQAGSKVQTLGAGQVDATAHYHDQLHLYNEAVGPENLVEFHWPDYGINPYGNSIIANEDVLENRPEMVRSFLEATFKAYRWVIKNPERAIEIEREYVPEANKEKFLGMLKLDLDLMKSEGVLKHGLGWMTEEGMEENVRLVNEYFDIENELTVDELFTREFIPRYTWPYPEETN